MGSGMSSRQNNKTGQHLVYEYLTTEVLVRPELQGTFLSEQELAAQIGISRTPVREAFRLLTAEGLLEQIPNRGTRIPTVDKKQILDLMELRLLLETHAAQTALKQTKNSLLCQRLATTLEEQRQLLNHSDKPKIVEFIRLDQEFHAHLLNAAGNNAIIEVYNRIRVRQRLIGATALFAPTRWREVIEEHAKIVDSLKNKESEKAILALIDHLNKTKQVLLKNFSAES
ncbi:FCD domain-containing protein [Corynebacterium poyangense]|uniref:FCD domain-containing protein n=1 Tax=Corynebacterium poyangense TaxID=2684405 RepID=A0A7H0SL41_9CORY|nr:GntR family transcriptional regulator [Corynebacterium poyangense]QNQ89266.1 FCD domain-containing protein [Corynebacterium poyangense]